MASCMNVFILQSIKPRVETLSTFNFQLTKRGSLSYNPSNQGLKPKQAIPLLARTAVFILQSIKPRVETFLRKHQIPEFIRSLYPTIHQTKGWNYMLRQLERSWILSLSYNPSNQGLKHNLEFSLPHVSTESLSYNPSNQGLKPIAPISADMPTTVFILQSIKPRVETPICEIKPSALPWVFILQSIKPRVETNIWQFDKNLSLTSLSYNPSNQGLKLISRMKSTTV